MPRNLAAAVETAVTDERTSWVYLVELDFSSGFLRVTNAPFDITHQSNTFTGIGDLGSISKVEETVEGRVNSVTVSLTGVKTSMVSIALGDTFRWRRGTIWKAFLDDQNAVIDTPHIRFQGWMDSMPIVIGKEQSTINLTLTSRVANWEHAHDNPRWDDADHQLRRPGDKFFEFMPEIARGKEIFWGLIT